MYFMAFVFLVTSFCTDEQASEVDLEASNEVGVGSPVDPTTATDSVLNGESKKDYFRNSGIDVPEYRRNVIGDADGSPVVVQTGTDIKVLVEVPRVDIRVDIADFLRFINRFMGSAELKAYLGARNKDEEGDFDELIAFVKVKTHQLQLIFADGNFLFMFRTGCSCSSWEIFSAPWAAM